jgi:large subunit ribosomal protein L21
MVYNNAIMAKPTKTTPTGAQAVFKTGGKQYRVRTGEILKIEKLLGEHNVGDTVTFDSVLMTDTGSAITVGAPFISGAKVTATITEIGRAPKVVVGKFKQKSKYFVKNGHRQPFFAVKIESVA